MENNIKSTDYDRALACLLNHNTKIEMVLMRMESCSQTQDISILKHGILVRDAYLKIINAIQTGETIEGWRLPAWIRDPDILERLLPDQIIAEYQIFHDCGKPFCLQIDENGKRHFPNHQEVSYQTWMESGGNAQSANLMRQDMDIHLLKQDGVEEFSSRPEAMTLLLTGLAEVHANAVMFGGLESDSFKIKAKHIDQRGKAILKAIRSKETIPNKGI